MYPIFITVQPLLEILLRSGISLCSPYWFHRTDGKIQTDNDLKKQECIPVGCVPPARYRTGVSLTETPPPGQRPHSWTETPPGQRTSWTETPRTETPLDKHLWKHYLRKLRLRAVIMQKWIKCCVDNPGTMLDISWLGHLWCWWT